MAEIYIEETKFSPLILLLNHSRTFAFAIPAFGKEHIKRPFLSFVHTASTKGYLSLKSLKISSWIALSLEFMISLFEQSSS